MITSLTTAQLLRLVQRVFRPRPSDSALAILVDLPDEALPDHAAWAARRRMAVGWSGQLSSACGELGLQTVNLVFYRNVRNNNADLPDRAWVHTGGECPQTAEEPSGPGTPFEDIFSAHQILIAPTELSATAPLKLAARHHRFRAATMPGFGTAMIPALRLDYAEISQRCEAIKVLLDEAVSARLRFRAEDRDHELVLDLRHRTATASGGLITEPGTAGNLPSGETYIVPYEGERPDDPSRSRGLLPLDLDGELLYYRIERNRTVEVIGDGPRAVREREQFRSEPGYANVAELGLGLLADYGVEPVGEVLLDEKLGLHVAFGRSDHFGGTVGPADFSAPERVVHIDRVYIPAVQPRVRVLAVDLEMPGQAGDVRLIQDGRFVRSTDPSV